MRKPICYDLFCGLGGWTEGFLAEGYECIGFDIEAHDYGTGGYPGELILRDVRSIHGSELKDATCIVGSSPCQEFSYRSMPWKRAKALPPPYLGIELFNAQFRIQREAIEAAGHYISMVVENVRGAQKWVGRAKYHFGSFYLWGDVPALMPIPQKATKVPGFRFDGESHGSFQSAAVAKMEGYKTAGMNWSDRSIKGQDFTRIAGNQADGVKVQSEKGRRTDVGKGARFTTRDCGIERMHLPNGVRLSEPGHESSDGEQSLSDSQLESVPISGLSSSQPAIYADRDSQGIKQHGSGHVWYRTGNGSMSSKSSARKRASAMIAKIPFPLSSHIARTFKPKENI